LASVIYAYSIKASLKLYLWSTEYQYAFGERVNQFLEIIFNKILKEELTIEEIQEAFEMAVLTSKELVMYYLYRIARYSA
jgi:hypothetical protein